MGIETDWNCAISLRPLEDSTQPDPHRMTSSYADWDVKVIAIVVSCLLGIHSVFTSYVLCVQSVCACFFAACAGSN